MVLVVLPLLRQPSLIGITVIMLSHFYWPSDVLVRTHLRQDSTYVLHEPLRLLDAGLQNVKFI